MSPEPPRSPLPSFLAPAVLRAMAGDARLPRVEEHAGAVLLADISGFTALAEALARQGARGAEELTRVLNGVLGALVARIAQDGGEVVKFAGDALLATWTGEGAVLGAWRAAACGEGLHAVATQAAAAAGVQLNLSVGVAAGELRLLLVQGSASRAESLPVGPPLAQVAVASHVAQAGETVLAAEAWALLSDRATGAPRAQGCAALVGLLPPPPPPPPPPAPVVPADRLVPFLPLAVRDRLEGAGAEWLSELRRASVLFVHVDLGAQPAVGRVQELLARICAAVDRHGGAVDKLTVDEKGLVAVAAMGLPPLAHPDDPLRATRAALELHADLRARGLPAAVGVATGRVFCGAVGSDLRREYTVIGDTVNLAARLMQHAGDGVLVDEGTAQGCRGAVGFLPPRTLRLKGKAAPVPGYVPVALAEAAAVEADPVRAPELARLREALDGLARGQGGLWWIEGAPGLGKSTLVERLLAEARARGVATLAGAADAQERGAPYRAWRSALAALLGLDPAADADARAALVRQRLAGDAWAEARAPLLAEPLGLPLPDNELTASLSGEVRAFNTQDLLVRLLRAATEGPPPRPLLVTLEDAQWMDSASFGLLREVARQVPGALLVLAGRPADGPLPAAAQDLRQAPGCHLLALRPLDAEGTAGLLRRVLGAEPEPELLARVHQRAEGNPFFTVELARGLQAEGAVELAADRARLREAATLRLPETVEGAILARIDRLDAVGQLLVKVASVIGRSFTWGLVSAVHPVAAHQPVLRARCEALVQADLTELEAAGPAGGGPGAREPADAAALDAWRYRHETTREVAYELLLYAQRRQLHEAVAERLERATPGAAVPHARLAWHWAQAERPDRALPHLEIAGDQALREGAYQEALDAFTRVEALLDGPDVADAAARRAHAALQRGEALLGLGRLAESRQALEQAVLLLGFPAPRGPVARGLDLVRGLLSQLLRRALRRPLPAPEPALAARHRKAARAALRIIETCFFLAGPVETTHAALRALEIAEDAGPSPELARAYVLFGWILSMVPLFGAADHYLALANALVERPDCRAGLQPVRFFTGFTRTATGRWEEARAALTEAIELAREQGDKRRWIEAVCGMCSPMHYQGEYEARIELGKGVLYASARRQGDRQAEAWGILDQLESLLPLGDLDRLAPLLDELEPYLDRPIGRSEHVWAAGMLALGRLRQGRREEALAAASRAVDAAAAMDPVAVYVYEGYAAPCEVLLALLEEGWTGQPPEALRRQLRRALRQLARYARVFPFARARLLGLRGRARGDDPRARALLRQAVAAAVAIRMPLEEALARQALARRTGDADEAARAEAIYARLGAAPVVPAG